jgi:putative ABC transport system permease protein
MSGFLHDLRFAIRMLRRSPAATASAVVMLALGVGSATAIFSIVNSVLVRPLPWRDSERIMTLWELAKDGHQMHVSTLNYQDWRSQSTRLEFMTALGGSPATLAGGERSARGYAAIFHGDVLDVYGLHLAAGRAFTEQETLTGSPPVAVVSNGLAKQLWDDPDHAVGKTLDAGGMSLTVIGVIEPLVDDRTDVYFPAAVWGPDGSTRSAHNWQVLARLRPGVTIQDASAEMQAIGQRIYRQYASETNAVSVEVSSLLENTVKGARSVLLGLLAAGGLLILIACANVANLLLAQGVARRREIAIRQTLGASRRRLVRQLLIESALLGLLAGAAGTLLAQWSFTSLLHMIPGNLPRISEISMDSTALGFSLLVSLAAGLLFGLAPALRANRSLAHSLKEQGRTSTGGDTALRRAFVIGEFALALAMLICAGLLAKSFVRLLQVDPGFRYEQAVVAETELPAVEYPEDAALRAFWSPLLERLAALPDVEHVGLGSDTPLEGFTSNGGFQFLDEPGREGYAWYSIATAGYFPALGIPLRRGRLFDESDVPDGPQVAVINETAAQRFWPGEDPIGKRVAWYGMDHYGNAPMTVVGVVGDALDESLRNEPHPAIYMDFYQRPDRARDADLIVKARTDVARLPGLLRQELKASDASLPVRIHTLGSTVDNSLAQPRFQMLLFLFFAACAVLLSAVGLFSSIAYAVSRQTREFGIRLALGATPQAVRRHVLHSGMGTTLLGIALGMGLGLGSGRLISTFLFGVGERDVSVFAAAAFLLAVTAMLACYLPARRASRVDPMEALRYE